MGFVGLTGSGGVDSCLESPCKPQTLNTRPLKWRDYFFPKNSLNHEPKQNPKHVEPTKEPSDAGESATESLLSYLQGL